jgi:ATP-binding cassette subfamily B protein
MLGDLTLHLGKGVRELPHLSRALKLIWTAARRETAAWLALLVVQGLIPIATVYLAKSFVDRIAWWWKGEGDPNAAASVVMTALLLATCVLAGEIAGGAVRWVGSALSENIKDHIAARIQEKSVAVDLSFYDSPHFYDHLHRARDDSGARSVALLNAVGRVGQATITLVAMLGVLTPVSPWLAAALIASNLPAVAVVVGFTLKEHAWWVQRTGDQRESWYYDWLLTSSTNAAEIRLFGLGELFRARYEHVRERLRAEHLGLVRGRAIAEISAAAAGLAIAGLGIGWIVWRGLDTSLTLGDMTLVYVAFQRGQMLMETMLSNVSQLYANVFFLGGLFQFLALESTVQDPAEPRPLPAVVRHEIRFERVSFCYAETGRAVLCDFDLVLPAGRIVALVGPNGAGKSTLVKLLCRFYDPEAGRILVDGIDLRHFRQADWRSRISVVFQEPVHYNASVADNIGYGSLTAACDRAAVEEAARAAGADKLIAQLPRR